MDGVIECPAANDPNHRTLLVRQWAEKKKCIRIVVYRELGAKLIELHTITWIHLSVVA